MSAESSLAVVDFKTEYRANRDPVDWVLLAPRGAAYTSTRTWMRMKDVTPPTNVDSNLAESETYQAMIARWLLIEPAYAAWKEGQDIPESGTPLESWSGVSPAQVAFLKGMAIRTVEDVAAMNEQSITACRWPNARRLPEMAQDYLSGADVTALQESLAEKDERIAAMEEMLKEIAAAKEVEAKPKPKPRTRQKKADE